MKRLALAAWAVLSLGMARAEPAYQYNQDAIARDFLWLEFQDIPASARPKVGVALSGGGARGFAHVGVMEVLTENGFPVDCLAGTSMGAVVGSFYASGVPFSQLWKIGQNASFSLVSKDFNSLGLLSLLFADKLLSSEKMENFINDNIGRRTFEELRIPFACTAMDIKTGERILFTEGPLAVAVRSSMNLPGIFKPVHYRHRLLVDGGVADNIPVGAARQLCGEWVLASVSSGDYGATELNNVVSYLLQTMDIRGEKLAAKALADSNFIIDSNVRGINFADLSKSYEAGIIGREAAYRRVGAAKESLILFSLDSIMEKYDKDR